MTDDHVERIFTTFEVARLCGVFHSTVLHWIDKGKLKACANAGKQRRILQSELVSLMQECGIPMPPDIKSEPKRILIIDDDPAISRGLERAWDHDGDAYAILAVNNPVEGLIEVGRHQPDALILDLLMPILSGYEVCRILKAGPATRGIRIVAITASTPSASQSDFLAENADVLLLKPFDPRKLVGIVDQLLD
ncbi:MAG: response regulator [Elusimicrobia bacterium]|nr:response regulator [Elusimicrobiota bacterium]